ncbi:MAG: hypothetical protein RL026_2014 [Pseudomonadota bacterium]|jgi:cell division transport system ATP-binding protein
MITFDRVHKRYPNGREALGGVSFEVAKGEMVFLTGRSGAGKSSVLRLVALLDRPTRGKVYVNGQDTSNVAPRRVPAFRRRLGIVFQDHKLLAGRSIHDNVALPLVVAQVSQQEIDKRVRAALDQVGLLAHRNVRPEELSVGEQQRVGIARAVVAKPDLLVADEPTGNLDPQLSAEVMQLFRRFSEANTTVLVATHDLNLVHASGLRQIVLHEGRLQEDIEEGTARLPMLGARR